MKEEEAYCLALAPNSQKSRKAFPGIVKSFESRDLRDSITSEWWDAYVFSRAH